VGGAHRLCDISTNLDRKRDLRDRALASAALVVVHRGDSAPQASVVPTRLSTHQGLDVT